MTIRDLYELCNNIRLDTETSIIDYNQHPIFWNSPFASVTCEMMEMRVEYFEIRDNEVRIWVQ